MNCCVGDLTATTILAEIGDISNFPTPKTIGSFRRPRPKCLSIRKIYGFY
ncbi:MAG: transposase [Bacillota bacterium]